MDYFDIFAGFIHILNFYFNKMEEKKEKEEKLDIDEDYKKIKEALDQKFIGIEKLNYK